MRWTPERLRAAAVRRSLSGGTSLAGAVAAMTFVQYDPIRRPARAQDLILHQRVAGYREGDLERSYPDLDLEEDFFYVYGVVGPDLVPLLHPRQDGYEPSGLSAEVLAAVRARGSAGVHEIRSDFETKRVVNAWGGTSAATTSALQELHHHGLLRVVRRDRGNKVYAPRLTAAQGLTPVERLRASAVAIAGILAPVTEPTLRAALGQVRQSAPGLGTAAGVVADLVRTGELEAADVDRARYLWPAHRPLVPAGRGDRTVRFLAPFDPVVWDRLRFERLWGWPYRFEAYTPPPRRTYGYYALPMLHGDDAVGWVNCDRRDGRLAVDPHLIDGRPATKAFRGSFDDEVDRLRTMLAVNGSGETPGRSRSSPGRATGS
jgi:uncharacterized protein YcaQ